MIYVTIDLKEGLEWLTYRRLPAKFSTRRLRHFYTCPAYPGLLIQTQGADFQAAKLETLAPGPLIALWSGPEENSPERWRQTLVELVGKEITCKLTLFCPEEEDIPHSRPLAGYLAERYGKLNEDLRSLQARAARHAGMR